ncbi:MAG TPA: FkbM family methyltransferase [Cyclobacteriaceae bacterium]|nr:FkbM family methyltransferase [Cyclobacteriaceae bacterium]
MGIYDRLLLNQELIPEWETRIDDVMKCPDNNKIPRVKSAGLIKNGIQFMHNGIPMTAGGYYGSEIAQMLRHNKGVHEPQEEYVFDKVLNGISHGAIMVELGCYWGFYSIWFLSRIKDSRAILVEPDPFNLAYGKNNFRLNKLTGDFTLAYIAGKSTIRADRTKTISVPDLVAEKHISFIDILHADIQGAELEMLWSCENLLRQKAIGYLFISTHGQEIHQSCLDYLMRLGYSIVCEADMNDTYSYDGLIVSKSEVYPGIASINISKKTQQ